MSSSGEEESIFRGSVSAFDLIGRDVRAEGTNILQSHVPESPVIRVVEDGGTLTVHGIVLATRKPSDRVQAPFAYVNKVDASGFWVDPEIHIPEPAET